MTLFAIGVGLGILLGFVLTILGICALGAEPPGPPFSPPEL